MSLVHSQRTMLSGDVAAEVQRVMREAFAQPGKAVQIPPETAARLELRLTSCSLSSVAEIRKRERVPPPDLLSLHLA